MSANLNLIDLLRRNQPRQPWDERLPSGQSPNDLLRGLPRHGSTEIRTGEETQAAPLLGNPAIQRAAQAVPNRDLVSLLKQPPPQPTQPLTAIPAGLPLPNEGRTVPDTPIPPINVGADVRGQSPVQRQQSLVDLMRATPAGQKVRQHGDEIEVSPPEQSPSRVKNALTGLLLGLAQGGLPGGVAGAATGAIKPGAIQELLRQKHLAREEDQLGRQIALDDKRADSEYRRAQIDVLKEGRRQYVERTDGVYEISREFPNGRRVADIPSEARAKPAANRHYFEREDGVYYVDDEHPQGVKLGGVPGKPPSDAQAAQAAEGEALANSTQAAADSLKSELDQFKGQLTENERAITQKEGIWNAEAARRVKAAQENLEDLTLKDALAQVQAEDKDFASGTYAQTVENTKRLRESIESKQKQYDTMQGDIREGRAKGARGGRGGQSGEDSMVRKYADQFFGGDYAKAQAAIKQQRGQ